MEISRDSFAAALPDILEHVKRCSFFSIDLEMTGIRLNSEPEDPTMDVGRLYSIKSRVAQKFNIIQVGICLFEPISPSGGDAHAGASSVDPTLAYVARPFNFYVFPDSVEGGGRDVVLDADTLGFLRKHGMDFQRWVYTGVSCCTAAGEAQIRSALADAAEQDAGALGSAGPASTDSLTNAVDRTWFEEGVRAATTLDCATADASGALQREVVLKPTKSSHARQVLKEHLAGLFPHIKVTSRGRFPNRDVVLTKISPEELRKAQTDATERRERELVDKIGFRHIFKALSDSGKPCVAHNSFADFLFLLATFQGQLPPHVDEFRTMLHAAFPVIYDTKHLSRDPVFPRERFENTSLGALYDEYSGQAADGGRACKVTLPLGFHAYAPQTLLKSKGKGSASAATAAHEAGYDALMTGVVFLNLVRELGAARAAAKANYIAIFRGLYALSVVPGIPDAYMPDSKTVLLVEHSEKVRSSEVESVVGGIAPLDQALSVNELQTLVVLESAVPDVAAITRAIEAHGRRGLRASKFEPPHLRTAPKGDAHKAPHREDANEIGGGGGRGGVATEAPNAALGSAPLHAAPRYSAPPPPVSSMALLGQSMLRAMSRAFVTIR